MMRPFETRRLPVMIVLLASAASGTGPADSWIGRKVIVKSSHVHPRIGAHVVDGGKDFHIYRVGMVQREWLWVVSGEVRGWIQAQEAIPYAKALDVITEQIRSHPTAASHTLRGNVWLEKTQYEIAIGDFTEAIRLDPKNAEAYARRGDARLARLNAFVRTLEGRFQGRIVLPSDDHPDLVSAKKHARSEADLILDDYQKALAIEPGNARAFVSSGEAWLFKEESDRALGCLDEAIRLDPKSSRAYLVRSGAWYAKDERNKALADLDTALTLDPRNVEALQVRVRADDFTGQYDRLIAHATTLLEFVPGDAGIYILRGNAWEEKKEYAKARADFEAALRVNPGNEIARHNLDALLQRVSTKH